MKHITILIFVCLAVLDSYAQTPKRVIVEHFTNTVCSICSSRNPGFYANLNNHPNILHIAYHPSSPYSSCLFNMQNVNGNDDRTNYYGIYGSTPKLVIQGENVPVSADYGDASIFDDYENQLSPIKFELTQLKDGAGITFNIKVINTSLSEISNATLFAGIAEDIVNYDAPNGENIHYDVFRKAFAGNNGIDFSIAGNDSLIYLFNAVTDIEWNYDELYSYVLIQQADTKQVIQAAATTKDQNGITIGIDDTNLLDVVIYPNPVKSILNIDFKNEPNTKVEIFDIKGALVKQSTITKNSKIVVSDLAIGTYFISVENKKGKTVKKFIKQ